MSTPDPRSLSEVAADIHDALSGLNDALLDAGARPAALHEVHVLIAQMRDITETLALSGLGHAHATGVAHDGPPQRLDDLVTNLNSDLVKLSIGLHDAGLSDPVAISSLHAKIDVLHGVASALTGAPDIAALHAAATSKARPSTAPLSSAVPGERATSLDYALRKFQGQLSRRTR